MARRDNRGLLIVEPPSQVRFSGPFTSPVVTTLTLINPTDNKIIFKIKTTAPSFYGVRPNFGVVQPRNFTEVEIARQPFNYNQNEKINHKFMVQSLMVPTNVEDLNKVWENSDPSQLNSSKLRCVFEMPTSISHMLSPATQVKMAPPHANENSMTNGTGTASIMPLNTLASQRESRVIISNANSQPLKPSIKTSNTYKNELPQESDEHFSNNQLETLNSELQQLKTENSVLRKENTMLKDEVEQTRSMITRRNNTLQQTASEHYPVPMTYVMTSVIMALVCIFIGKYIL